MYYPVPLHLQECFNYLNCSEGDFPVCEELSKTVVSIPVFPGMTAQQQDYVIDNIQSYFS